MLQLRSDVEVMKLGMLVSRKLQFVSGQARGGSGAGESSTEGGPRSQSNPVGARAAARRAAANNGEGERVAVDGQTVVLRRQSKGSGGGRERTQSFRQSVYKMFSKSKRSGSGDGSTENGSPPAATEPNGVSAPGVSASPPPPDTPGSAGPATPVAETSVDSALAERRMSIRARVPTRIAKCYKQLRTTPADVEVPADQVSPRVDRLNL